jgi:hypothetical protein
VQRDVGDDCGRLRTQRLAAVDLDVTKQADQYVVFRLGRVLLVLASAPDRGVSGPDRWLE